MIGLVLALARRATWTVEGVYAYAEGRIVSDERWMRIVGGSPRASFPAPSEVRRVWYPTPRPPR